MSTLSKRDRQLLFVSISLKDVVGNLRHGAHIERQLGKSIDKLLPAVSADRFKLGAQFLTSGRKALKSSPPQYRTAASRAYYAMYHAARAVVYVVNGGDDFQDHSKLSPQLPDDFPNVAVWRNNLRKARLLRNRCDYDPYPRHQKAFAVESEALLVTARDFLALSKNYLMGRGCSL